MKTALRFRIPAANTAPAHPPALYARSMGAPSQTESGRRVVSIRERAYLVIQQLIINGTMPAGSSISEPVLARELGSSRTPIREAISQLAAEGLLTQGAGRRMFVVQLSREDIIELYGMREALEVYAAGQISRRLLPPTYRIKLQELVDDIEDLENKLHKTKMSTLDALQMKHFTTVDLGFHALLMSMTNNTRLQKELNETRLLINVFAMYRKGHDAAMLKNIRECHQQILDAVSGEDAHTAMLALSNHIQQSRERRLNEFDEWRRESSLRDMSALIDIHSRGS